MELAFKGRVPLGGGTGFGHRAAPPDDDLPKHRLNRDGARPESPVVSRHVTPAEYLLPFLHNDSLEKAFDRGSGCRITGQEDEPRAVAAFGGQADTKAHRLVAQEAIRHLHEDARAVTGIDLAAAGAAMQQIDQQLQRLLHDRMRPLPLYVHDEADATGVALVLREIQPLPGGLPFVCHNLL
jgi:hypothetical protein